MSEGKPKKRWTKKQLRASQGILTQQAKTNIYDSQKGMTTFGAVRHGPDIRSDDSTKESESLLTQQTLTNIYDSQKGNVSASLSHSLLTKPTGSLQATVRPVLISQSRESRKIAA